MAQFHTLKQACEVTGKSESTLKRLISSIRNDPDSPDRQLLLPSVEQYDQLKKEGKPFQWEISETVLRQRYPDAFETNATEPEKGSDPSGREVSASFDTRYVEYLEKQAATLEETNAGLRQQNSELTTSLTNLTDRVTHMLGHYQVKTIGPVENPGTIPGGLPSQPTNRIG